MSGRSRLAAAHRRLGASLLKEPPPLRAVADRRYYRWLIVGTVCIGAFMGQVDASIAQLVLPELEREFDRGLAAISWVSLAYLLALAVFLPVFGRLADLYGRKLLYSAGFLLFILGSALCGAADDFSMLVGFRVLQAIGAALLQANSIAIVVSAAGRRYRGRAIGVQAAAQAIGLSAGPAIGGALISALSWRWVFWINVPVGAVGALLGWLVLPQTQDVPRRRPFDWQGVLLLAPGITALLLLITQGRDWGVGSPAFIGCGVAVLSLLPLFVRRERCFKSPLLDLKLFRLRAFWAGNVAGLLSYAMLFGLFFLMPFVFMRGYRESALEAGIRLAAVPAALGALSPLAGALHDRLGPRRLTGIGMGLCLLAFLTLAWLLDGSRENLVFVMAALVLFGLGLGLFTSPNNSAVMAAAPNNRIGQAGGILNVMRSFGTSLGVAAASAMLAWRLGILTGHAGDTLHAPPAALLSASRDAAFMFAGFALAASGLSWLRPETLHRADPRREVPTLAP